MGGSIKYTVKRVSDEGCHFYTGAIIIGQLPIVAWSARSEKAHEFKTQREAERVAVGIHAMFGGYVEVLQEIATDTGFSVRPVITIQS